MAKQVTELETTGLEGHQQPITGPLDAFIQKESRDSFIPADQTLCELVAASLLEQTQTEYELGLEGSKIRFSMESVLGSDLTPQQISTIQATRKSYQELWASPFVPPEVSESIIWNAEEDASENVLHQIVTAYDELTGTETTIVMRIFLVDIDPETQNSPSDLTNWKVTFDDGYRNSLLEIFKNQTSVAKKMRVGICSRLASRKTPKVKTNVSQEIRKQRRAITTATAYALMTLAQNFEINIWSYTVTEELIESVLAIQLSNGGKLRLPFQLTTESLRNIFSIKNIAKITLANNEEVAFLKHFFTGYWLDPASVREILEQFRIQKITFPNFEFINVIIEYFITLNNLIVNELKNKGFLSQELLDIKEKYRSITDIISMLSTRKYMHLLTPLFNEYPEFAYYILTFAQDGCLSVTMTAEEWTKGTNLFLEQIKKISLAKQEEEQFENA
jgi:hypothetical protein